MKRWWLISLFCSTCFGAGEIELAEDNVVETGVIFQILLPNILPSFPKSLGVYGPYVGIPLGSRTIQVQGFYGKSEEQTAMLGEISLKQNVRTPFFTAHLQAGPHFLKSSFSSLERSYLGGFFGFGFDVPFSKTFQVGVLMKLYVQERSILAFGGGFGIFL